MFLSMIFLIIVFVIPGCYVIHLQSTPSIGRVVIIPKPKIAEDFKPVTIDNNYSSVFVKDIEIFVHQRNK